MRIDFELDFWLWSVALWSVARVLRNVFGFGKVFNAGSDQAPWGEANEGGFPSRRVGSACEPRLVKKRYPPSLRQLDLLLWRERGKNILASIFKINFSAFMDLISVKKHFLRIRQACFKVVNTFAESEFSLSLSHTIVKAFERLSKNLGRVWLFSFDTEKGGSYDYRSQEIKADVLALLQEIRVIKEMLLIAEAKNLSHTLNFTVLKRELGIFEGYFKDYAKQEIYLPEGNKKMEEISDADIEEPKELSSFNDQIRLKNDVLIQPAVFNAQIGKLNRQPSFRTKTASIPAAVSIRSKQLSRVEEEIMKFMEKNREMTPHQLQVYFSYLNPRTLRFHIVKLLKFKYLKRIGKGRRTIIKVALP